LSNQKWRIVSKETIFEAVKDLEINPQQLNYVLDAAQKSHLEEILMAFGESRYKSYKAVRKTLMDTIGSFAAEGNNIIIGRAGALITAGIRAGIHIRLTASRDWRTKSISTQQGISQDAAALFVDETDEKRRKLFKDFSGNDPDNSLFDLVINNERISDEDAVQLIIKLMEQRKCW
ncbi:MAG TPA: cytidylate kinase-like family protein, partial [Bacteroidales bacterium]|nr:cytidylate kinase-like family protein [Bacteroidales bacterium]